MLRKPDIGFLPTPPEIIDRMFDLVPLTAADQVYDLGSGDGRILIAAAQRFGAQGVGIDIDGDRVREARQQAEIAGVSQLLSFVQADLYESDFSAATVVILYLLPHLNLKLRPTLFRQLKPGTRILSHDFDMGDWPPEQVIQIPSQEADMATLYVWTMPPCPPIGAEIDSMGEHSCC